MLRNTVLEARDIWKRYEVSGESSPWVLSGVHLEILEGDFIAILGGPASGKTSLLKVLSFRQAPQKGAVYFEGRLVGRSGSKELEQMTSERVWFVEGPMHGDEIIMDEGTRLAAVLLDEPGVLLYPENDLLEQIYALNRLGVAVVVATRDPEVASRASLIYKLREGKLEKLNGSSDMVE